MIAVVVVATLFASGALPLRGSAPSPSPYATFDQAQALATDEASSAYGGEWFAVFGVALAIPSAVLEPTGNLTPLLAIANCTTYWPNGEPANLDLPPTPATAATGAAAFWLFGLKNASNELVVAVVSDGAASVLVTAQGSSCASTVALLAPFPTGEIDSPQIVTTANAAGGTQFLSAHANATRLWATYGGIELGPLGSTTPVWSVDYTTCTVPPISGTQGDVFNATIGGTSGAVIANATGTTTCLPALSTGTGLTVPAGGASGAVRKAI